MVYIKENVDTATCLYYDIHSAFFFNDFHHLTLIQFRFQELNSVLTLLFSLFCFPTLQNIKQIKFYKGISI